MLLLMTLDAERDHVEPMLPFIAVVVVIMFGRFAAFDTFPGFYSLKLATPHSGSYRLND